MDRRRLGWSLGLALVASGCTFNFDVTSQRTALENQVMGSYKELDDDLILASSVRAAKAKVPAPAPAVSQNKRRALDARQNQLFNRDDIEEFKAKQLLGEAADGMLVPLPKALSKADKAEAKEVKLALQIALEENRDRQVIWDRIIEANDHLTSKDLPNVRLTYAKMLRGSAAVGVWYQDAQGTWVQKSAHDASEL